MRSILLCTLLLISVHVCAQFTDSTQRMINFTSSGILNKTNDGRSYVFNNAIRFGLKKKSLEFNSGASYIYGQNQTRLTNNDFSSFLDFNLYKTFPGFYYWGLAGFDKSYSLKINRRFQTGLGVAYNFINVENAYVNLSNGILYEASNLQLTDSTVSSYETLRNSMRLRMRFVMKKNIVFETANFWQPSLSDREDYILKSTAGISVKLIRWLSFTTALTFNKLNQTRRENLLLTFGLTMENFF